MLDILTKYKHLYPVFENDLKQVLKLSQSQLLIRIVYWYKK
jgi:hypothetical protein